MSYFDHVTDKNADIFICTFGQNTDRYYSAALRKQMQAPLS